MKAGIKVLGYFRHIPGETQKSNQFEKLKYAGDFSYLLVVHECGGIPPLLWQT